MALSDLQLLKILETLVGLAKSNAAPGQALITVVGSHGREARDELARLADRANVSALAVKLGAHAAGLWAPPIVAEAASMLRDARRAEWLSEVGRLAAGQDQK